jgi:adenosylmethionine-8-amino-7-oxononanoate aminotransferase
MKNTHTLSKTEKADNVFHRKLDSRLPRAEKAEGAWIEDSEGRRYLDASGGPILVNVGHGREEIATAVHDQILKCDYVHGTMFTTSVVEDLAIALAKHSPQGIDRFYFLSTGAEAVETAIKLARQIQIDSGRLQRFKLISRWKSYHGLTLGALSAMGRTTFRVPFAPLLTEVVHIPPPYCLRCSYGLTYPKCGLRCALALEETIQNVGPDIVSAFLAETVIGATLASCPPPPGYFKLIREICDRYNVLLILDEVMCGLGRTGRWFAAEHYDVVPDIVTLGKGLSGGVAALSAVGVQSKYFDVIKKGTGNFIHGGTYSHHAVAAAAGLSTIGILQREKLVERVDHYGKILGKKLKKRIGNIPNVADIRGIGFMWGIEIVKDKKTLKPFPRQDKVAERLWEALFQKGIITYKSTGLAGIDGDALMVAPPFIIEDEEMDLVVESIGQVLENTFS